MTNKNAIIFIQGFSRLTATFTKILEKPQLNNFKIFNRSTA